VGAAASPAATDLERFLDVIWRPGDVREIRILGRRGPESGYFDDVNKLTAAVKAYDGRENVYMTINPVDPALLARAANRIASRARSTTSDSDVVSRRWLPVDIDPVRPTGISASDVECEHALATARSIYQYLHEMAWPDPVTAMSGNGYWLLYPIDLPNDAAAKGMIEGVLAHLSGRFSSSAVAIDTTVSNASRIVALIGTMKVKGDPTIERPHRRSRLSFSPAELRPVPTDRLRQLLPTAKAGTSAPLITIAGDRMPAGWVKKLLDDNGIQYREGQRNGQTWYRLNQCPFHPDDDQGGDCGVTEGADGMAGGKCFHNRGAGKGWQEFKAALGIESKIIPFAPSVRQAVQPPAMRGMDAADLLALDLAPLRWIVPDMIPEGTTVLAAPPKVGKSCLVYQIAVESSIGGELFGRRVTPGSVLYFALEDGKRRGQDRLRAVLAGRTMPRGRLEVRWDAPPITQGLEEEIAAWLDDHPDAVMVAVDTLGKARPGTDGRKGAYEVDVEHLKKLQSLFRDRSVGLLIVHHSRKEKAGDFLASVSGTYGITGSVDTIVVINRQRHEQFGQIHTTGRDVPDSIIPARFDGLLWLSAPGAVNADSFEQSEVLAVIERLGPVFAKRIGDELGIERTAAQHRIEGLISRGFVIRMEGGYIVNRNPVIVADPSYIPLHSSHSLTDTSTLEEEQKGVSELGDTRARTRAAARGWVTPCRDYAAHQSFHRQTPDGWICELCNSGGAA
jgi:hypothetical protein